MICTSIQNKELAEIQALLQHLEMQEVLHQLLLLLLGYLYQMLDVVIDLKI